MNPTIAHLLGRNWWLILLRGLAAILFGFLAFAWPGLTLVTLVAFFGAYVLIDGVLALAAAVRGGKGVSRGWLAFIGVLGIAAAIGTFLYPSATALALVLFIGSWSIVRGAFEIVGAIQLRKEIKGEWLLILSGIMSIVFGTIVWLMPGPGALAIVWTIGAYSIAFGAILTALAFRVRRHRTRESEEPHFHAPPPHLA
jgi:uncharacterized membrane protein HdeD (DUF308 family)